jgi:hypothetical protein
LTAIEFLEALPNGTSLERAAALLWFVGRDDRIASVTTKEICRLLEGAGHARQNASRLDKQLASDRRVHKTSAGGWRLSPAARKALDGEYSFAQVSRVPPATDSVLPRSLFDGTRGYIEKVVDQINKSYDAQLFDCCAVMCRRLLETLIIELYEKRNRAHEILGANGHFLMLNPLISFLEADTTIRLGRNGQKGLKDFKTLGDLSAHNRRFNARQPDIDRVRDGLRVATEELIHLIGF